MRKVIILQARLASSRFPNKVLADLCGRPVIWHILERLRAARLADAICVAIPADGSEDRLALTLADMGVQITRGSNKDVLARYVQAAYQTGAQVIVRATADNALVCCNNIDRQLGEFDADPQLDYVITEGFPRGVTTETFTLRTLEKLDFLAKTSDYREHVTLFLRENPKPFHTSFLEAPADQRLPGLNLSIDTLADYEIIRRIYDRLYQPGKLIGLDEVLALQAAEPGLFSPQPLEVSVA